MGLNKHETDVLVFACLMEAQAALNRAKTFHFRAFGLIHEDLDNAHNFVSELTNDYRTMLVGNEQEGNAAGNDGKE